MYNGLVSEIPVFDVRSPSEFKQGHLPGAISFPLFDDAERAIVGTLYKQQGKELAVLEGLRIVGPKLAGFVEQAIALAPGRELSMYCWRGGMRSGSMAWLLRSAGFTVRLLQGGYKAYRQTVQNHFTNAFPFIVLSGPTGSGKTEILVELRALGEQVIDLEDLAKHRGSAFGALGMDEQPSIEQFENNLYQQLEMLDLSKRIWIEDESRNIGKVALHDGIWQNLDNAPLVLLESSMEDRVLRLVKEYGKFDPELLRASLNKIAKRLGGLTLQEGIEALETGDLAKVAEITLRYYDKSYHFSREKRGRVIQKTVNTIGLMPNEIAQLLLK
jgi:tRNA 2-selenouridine synthase